MYLIIVPKQLYMQPIVTSIQKLLKKKLNIYSPSINSKTDLKKDLNLVDWEMQYLFNVIEQTWHISITQQESEKIVNIQHLLAVVKKQVPGNNLHMKQVH